MSNVDDFLNWQKSASDDELKAFEEKQKQSAELGFNTLKSFQNRGLCYLCRSPLRKFHPEKPCLHWLLLPKGIRKKNLEEDLLPKLERLGCMRTNTYLRWVANAKSPIRLINDFEKSSPDSLIEETISYEDIRWVFSCKKADFNGHGDTPCPHYHLGIWRDNGRQVFLKLNDTHIRLTEEDKFHLELLSHPNSPEVIRPFAEGMAKIMKEDGNNEYYEAIMKSSSLAEDYENATLNINTLIIAGEGRKISGEQILRAYEKAKSEGTSVAY